MLEKQIDEGKEMLVGIPEDQLKWYQGYITCYQDIYSAVKTGVF